MGARRLACERSTTATATATATLPHERPFVRLRPLRLYCARFFIIIKFIFKLPNCIVKLLTACGKNHIIPPLPPQHVHTAKAPAATTKPTWRYGVLKVSGHEQKGRAPTAMIRSSSPVASRTAYGHANILTAVVRRPVSAGPVEEELPPFHPAALWLLLLPHLPRCLLLHSVKLGRCGLAIEERLNVAMSPPWAGP